MLRYLVLNKAVGETPLAAITRWKTSNPAYRDVKSSYAGRLDPMASGKLLVLLGDECRRQYTYLGLDKAYDLEILFDVGSDTGDILGLVTGSETVSHLQKEMLMHALEKEVGTHVCSYPLFSSKTVQGKPLFLHTLEHGLHHITIPTHTEHIYRILFGALSVLSHQELRTYVTERLEKIPHTQEPSKRLGADFRSRAVRASWKALHDVQGKRSYLVAKVTVIAGSGTYMRTLAQRIGNQLGTNALALSITRTKIGRYLPLTKRWGIWLRTF